MEKRKRTTVTGSEFREAIKSMGLTQKQFALIIMTPLRTVQAWGSEESSVPQSVKAWLELLTEKPELVGLILSKRASE